MYSMDNLLTLITSEQARELRFRAGTPPVVVLGEEPHPMEGPPLTARCAEQLLRSMAKGLMLAEKAGKVTLFKSAVTREQAQRSELLYTLKHAFNGALTPMVQCLLDTEELTTDELTKIESLIQARRKKSRR